MESKELSLAYGNEKRFFSLASAPLRWMGTGIDGKNAAFRAVQARDKTKDFKVTDNWKAKASEN
jgi:hypothetical protein